MQAWVSWAGRSIEGASWIPSRSHAVPILQLFALTVMVIPSDAVIRAIGAGGYAAAVHHVPQDIDGARRGQFPRGGVGRDAVRGMALDHDFHACRFEDR